MSSNRPDDRDYRREFQTAAHRVHEANERRRYEARQYWDKESKRLYKDSMRDYEKKKKDYTENVPVNDVDLYEEWPDEFVSTTISGRRVMHTNLI